MEVNIVIVFLFQTVRAEQKSIDELQEELMESVRKAMEVAKDQPLKKLYEDLATKSG